MRKIIVIILLVNVFIPAPFVFSDENVICEHCELTKNLIDEKFKEHFKEESNFNNKYNEKIGKIDNLFNLYNEKISATNKTLDFNLTIITWMSGAVIALVALFLALGIFKIHIDHKKIHDDAKKLTKDCIDKWWEETEGILKEEADKLIHKVNGEMQDFSCFLRLKELLKTDDYDVSEVYPLLTPLTCTPKTTYRRLFTQIVELDIDPEVTERAQVGLDALAGHS